MRLVRLCGNASGSGADFARVVQKAVLGVTEAASIHRDTEEVAVVMVVMVVIFPVSSNIFLPYAQQV